MIKSTATADFQLLLTTTDTDDLPPSLTAVPLATHTIDGANQERAQGPHEIAVDGSSQIAYRGSAAAADIILVANVYGYIDRKERP